MDSRILESTFASLDDALLIVEEDTRRILRCNPAVKRIFGYAPEEMVGKTTEFLHVNRQAFERFKDEASLAIRREGVFRIEFRLRRKSGEEFYSEHTVTPILDPAGKRIAVVSLVRDITPRIETEKALVESEEKFRRVLETALEGIWTIDESARTTYMNQKMLEMLGYSAGEVDKAHLFDFVDEKDRPKAEKLLERRRRGISERHRFVFRRKDGAKVFALISTNPLFNGSGTYQGALAMVTDVTEKKSMEENLVRSEYQVQSLARRLSEAQELERKHICRELHDQVGQLISIIGMDLSLVRKLLPGSAPAGVLARLDEAVDAVEETGRRVRHLMENLRPSVLDQYGLLPAIRENAQRFSLRTGIGTVILGDPGNMKEYLGLELSLFRIAQEALVNVTKHAKAKEVEIRFEDLGEKQRMVISDNGRGFDLSLPAEPVTPKKGMGLVSMRERAEAVGATFRIQSLPDKGTTIIVEWRK